MNSDYKYVTGGKLLILDATQIHLLISHSIILYMLSKTQENTLTWGRNWRKKWPHIQNHPVQGTEICSVIITDHSAFPVFSLIFYPPNVYRLDIQSYFLLPP